MARIPNTIPSHTVKVNFKATTLARVDLELYSEVERKVPYGARGRFIEALVEDYFQRKDKAQKAAAAAATGAPA